MVSGSKPPGVKHASGCGTTWCTGVYLKSTAPVFKQVRIGAGFIRAEVISYEDYVKFGSESKAKEAGKARVEGKEYVVKDGDVMHFRFNV